MAYIYIAIAQGLFYVLSIHLFENYLHSFKHPNITQATIKPNNSKQLSESEKLDEFNARRQDPHSIKKRVYGATISTIIITIVSFIFLKISHNAVSFYSLFELMGLTFTNEPLSSIKVLLMSSSVYAASLYYELLLGYFPIIHQFQYFRLSIKEWSGFRNYFVGPITEELVFRASIVPIFVLANYKSIEIQFLAPLIFGIAFL
ncbi:hypothetical protein BB561_002575 [Smittium simulii]|uniref:Uncharacterized protein n=1 Tax=Smittium simulii TaxID=133385 RepID=A0A2T9YPX5_9FUNG|nr:hypothetical protein BB561_002575 [Smittium simulii]